MDDYPKHQKSAILLMKLGGLLSVTACAFIMRNVIIRYHRGERIRLTHKLVFELSLSLFWASFFSPFMSTWMVPRDSGAYQAAGNTASCTLQGFVDSFMYGLSVLLNAILALTYCIIAKTGTKDEARSKRSRWMILGLPPILCFLLACKPLFDKAYNYTDFHVCGIAEHPLGCLSDNYDSECERGESARELKIARFTCICLANLVIVVSVFVLVWHVMKSEKRMADTNILSEPSNDLTMKVVWQGIWYIAAFFFCWGPWYVWQWRRIMHGMETMSSVESPALAYFISVTYPLQGVANACVYFRPSYRKFRERDRAEWRIASVFRTLDLNVPGWLSVDYWRSLTVRLRDDDSTGQSVPTLS
ncbi:hypothetical protein ACHAXT_012582 [Thalassiosira profunda]